MIILPVFGACVASGLGVLLILRHCARQVIIFGNVAAICLILLSAAMAFSSDAAALGVVLLVLAFLHALWFYFAWHRIPFSAALLKASTDLVCRYKAIVLCVFLVCGFSFLYVILWCFMVQPLFDQKNGQPDTWNCLFLVLSVLSMFWVAQVCPNVMHVTTAGVTATWYFAGESDMPSNPTAASFKRSVTTSFGSICFGSLIVAFIRFLRWVVENFSRNDDEFLRCIVSCILSCIQGMAEYFNTYAFVHVAIYGCGYLEAAKKTWDLCKRCLYAAYFNDNLVGTTVQIICLTASVAIGIGTYCFTGDTTHSIIAFSISVVVHVLFVSPVESAVVTYFVCFAEVPEGLSQSAPELYNTLVALDQNATRNNAAAV
ncbi:putative Plasma membrane choline transporter [Trypanosoma vivax]|nr:putative Plasma membrane choline transporter [Trypanosoma vivax]